MNLPKAQIQKVAISGDMDFFYPESMRSTDFMDVDLHQNYQPAPNTGLIRYRSAPSSFFKNINADSGGGGYEEFTGTHPRSPEESSETVFGDSWQNGYSAAAAVVAPVAFRQQQAVAASLPPLQNHNSNLLRQSSSPPGVLDNMAMEIGFTNGMESSFSMGDRKGDRGDGTKGFSRITMPQIAEIGNLGTDPSFPIGSWDESPTFSPPKKFGENIDGSAFSSFHERFEAQNGGVGNITPPLAHHLSLPKTYSADMGTSERVWPFQDSVPCRVRAKRGCATHPRSIAERMRRTRISERMRKLQELFPNMDKQTNTADMLEVAVEYIKNLQKQVKTLTDTGAKCTCSSRERQYSDPTA